MLSNEKERKSGWKGWAVMKDDIESQIWMALEALFRKIRMLPYEFWKGEWNDQIPIFKNITPVMTFENDL